MSRFRPLIYCLLGAYGVFCLPACEQVSSQTAQSNSNSNSTFDRIWNSYPGDDQLLVITDDSDHYKMKWLRRDLLVSAVVAHVNVVSRQLVDATDGADCENNRGSGYCGYKLTAQIRKVYKGKLLSSQIEFGETADATYPKTGFIGERVIFLLQNEDGKLGTMENSTRSIADNILEKMSVIADQKSAINETDEGEPYSKIAIRNSFESAQEVAHVFPVKFEGGKSGFSDTATIVTARVIESFKGRLRRGQMVEYKEDYLYRKHNKSDLVGQVVYLSIPDSPEVRMVPDKNIPRMFHPQITSKAQKAFQNEEYTEAFIKHDILQKLRTIAKDR